MIARVPLTALVLLLALTAPLVGQSPVVFNVTTGPCGAVPNDGIDDTGGIRNAVDAAVLNAVVNGPSGVETVVYFPPGVYDYAGPAGGPSPLPGCAVPPGAAVITWPIGASPCRLTFDGAGATIRVHDPAIAFARLFLGNRIAIRGLTFNYATRLHTTAKVTALGPQRTTTNGSNVRYHCWYEASVIPPPSGGAPYANPLTDPEWIDPLCGCTEPGADPNICLSGNQLPCSLNCGTGFRVLDPLSLRLKSGTTRWHILGYCPATVTTASNGVSADPSDWFRMRLAAPEADDPDVSVGDVVVITRSSPAGHAFESFGVDGLTLDTVTLLQGGAFGARIAQCANIRITDCRVVPADGEFASVTADAFHILGPADRPIFDSTLAYAPPYVADNEISGNGDDGVAVYAPLLQVADVRGDAGDPFFYVVLQAAVSPNANAPQNGALPAFFFDQGSLEFFDQATLAPAGVHTISFANDSVASNWPGAPDVHLALFTFELTVASTSPAFTRGGLAVGNFVISSSMNAPGASILRNRVTNCGAGAFRIQTPDATVDSNVVDAAGFSGVYGRFSWDYFPEGAFSSGLTVTNNVFRRTGLHGILPGYRRYAAVDLALALPTCYSSTEMFGAATVTDNLIEGSEGAAVYLSNRSSVVCENNRIYGSQLALPSGSGLAAAHPLRFESCGTVSIDGCAIEPNDASGAFYSTDGVVPTGTATTVHATGFEYRECDLASNAAAGGALWPFVPFCGPAYAPVAPGAGTISLGQGFTTQIYGFELDRTGCAGSTYSDGQGLVARAAAGTAAFAASGATGLSMLLGFDALDGNRMVSVFWYPTSGTPQELMVLVNGPTTPATLTRYDVALPGGDGLVRIEVADLNPPSGVRAGVVLDDVVLAVSQYQ